MIEQSKPQKNVGPRCHLEEEQVREFKQEVLDTLDLHAEAAEVGKADRVYAASQIIKAHQKAIEQAETAARLNECDRLSKASGGGDWRRKLILRQSELKGVSNEEPV